MVKKKGQIPQGADCYEILSSSQEDKIYTKQMNDEIKQSDRLKAQMTRDVHQAKFSFLTHVQGQDTQISPKERQFRVRENYIKYFENNIGINIQTGNFKAKYEFKPKEKQEKDQNEIIIDPRHIIVFGVDLMSQKQIKSRFTGNYQPTIKWINSSNVSIKFNQNQDLQTLLQMQKLHKQNNEFIQNQDMQKKLSAFEWIEVKAHSFLKFQRKLEFRYTSTQEKQLETQKSDDYKKFIQAMNNIQKSDLFLKTEKQKDQYDAEIKNFAEQMQARYNRRNRPTSRCSKVGSNDGSQTRFRSRDQRGKRNYSQQFQRSERHYMPSSKGDRTERIRLQRHNKADNNYSNHGAKTSRFNNQRQQSNNDRRNNFDRGSSTYGSNQRGRRGNNNEYNAENHYNNRNFNRHYQNQSNYNKVKKNIASDLQNSSDISLHIQGKTDFQKFQQQNRSCSNSSLQMDRNASIHMKKQNKDNDVSFVINDQTLKIQLNKDNNASLSFGDQVMPLLNLSGLNQQKNNNISFINQDILIDIDKNQTDNKANLSFVQEFTHKQLNKRDQNLTNNRNQRNHRQRNQQSFGSFSRGNGNDFRSDNNKFAQSNNIQRTDYNGEKREYNNRKDNRNDNQRRDYNNNHSIRDYNNDKERRNNYQNRQFQSGGKQQWEKMHQNNQKKASLDSDQIDY